MKDLINLNNLPKCLNFFNFLNQYIENIQVNTYEFICIINKADRMNDVECIKPWFDLSISRKRRYIDRPVMQIIVSEYDY